jgi:serine/threonine protein kinase
MVFQEQQTQPLHKPLPPEIADLATRKIHKGLKRFLESSQFVSARATKKLPRFYRDEIVLGKLLGSGGFSHVYELKALCEGQGGDSGMGVEEEDDRHKMMEKSRRKYKGKSPFVVKHMKEKFLDNPNKFRHAGTDLLIEAHFLASLSHPHVLQIRGWTAGGADAYLSGENDGFFLIMDRLEETLDDRIQQWAKQLKRYKQPLLQKINPNMQELLFTGRLQVGRDIASALCYLHSKGIIYRDLKPGNIGFDSNGTVKIFDFGLSREMPDPGMASTCDAPGGERLYDLSGKIGTQRYMAPEVGCCLPYNQKADVYSLSLVVWECLSLVKPFATHSKSIHRALVLEGDERPPLDNSWPYGIRALLQCSWSAEVRMRPTMRAFQAVLNREIEELRSDTSGSSSGGLRTSWALSSSSKKNSHRSVVTMETNSGSCGPLSAFTGDSLDVF